ncbi:MAG: sugar transferase [Opitutaceae bacterium]|nr:sugar transferase [Opitutaceae bacterium]
MVIRRPAALRKLPAWKRAIDIICCLAVLPFFALGALVVGVMSMLFSPGPIFFRQERIGYRGRRFMIFKFRTMHLSSDVKTHSAHFKELIRSGVPMQKLDGRGDRRLVPGGWLLRASGLDELPQIINVLRGEMSLVGPRPCIPYEFELYTAEQRRRFESVPGLTGLWQVSGKNRTTFNEMVRLDIEYGERRSLGLDLWIMLMTVPALVTQIIDTRRAKRAAEASVGAPVPATATVAAERRS